MRYDFESLFSIINYKQISYLGISNPNHKVDMWTTFPKLSVKYTETNRMCFNGCCSGKAFETLIETSEGDMRKAITTLQSAARLRGDSEAPITRADIIEISGVSTL